MIPQRHLALAVILLLCLSVTGCGTKKQQPPLPVPSGGVCRDLTTMPQDLAVYAKAEGENRSLATPADQAAAAAHQKNILFRPWRVTKASPWLGTSLNKNFNLRLSSGYARDERPFPPSLWSSIEHNSNKGAYPSRQRPGITLRHTNLRAMPTTEHYYLKPHLPGEGYPFDYFQHSSLHAGTPVYICHVSRDGQWLLVDTSLTAGWLPASDVAETDEAFMRQWEQPPLAALVRDNVNIGGSNSHTGTLLPLAGGAAGGLGVYFPVRGSSGRAELSVENLPPDSAVSVPLKMTPAAVARIGNGMMGQPYGWGGIDQKRDCSALTRDLMTPFGFFLPRNSSKQIRTGSGVSLAGMAPQEKERTIMNLGVPFASLLWRRGHIGLYVGRHEGRPMMFHNAWGLRTQDGYGSCDGRAIIGKAVVTTLTPGIERSDLCESGNLLNRIETMAILPSSGSFAPAPFEGGMEGQ